MKKYILVTILFLLLSGCASTRNDGDIYNTLNNYEIVYVDDKMTKTSKLALQQINNNEEISKISIELFRQHENDLKSIIFANKKKRDIQNLLNEKTTTFNYNPKKTNKNAILKVE